jgi:signal transduction histidine kinase
VSARFTDDREDAASASHLSALFADHPTDLVIALGAPAAKFLQQFHKSLFRSAPELLTDMEERRAFASRLTPNETAVAISVSFPALVHHILHALPVTRTLAGVTGNSVIEAHWSLPPGSTVLVRELTAWQRYRWQIIFIAAVLVLETVLLVTLLQDRRRRRRAEFDAHQHMAELAELNRRATVGELSASIAHELTQPLSAISHNAEAAALILRAQSPDLSELRDIVASITRDQRCATEVIKRLRNLLGKTPPGTQEIDLSEAVREVFEFLSATAAARHITLSTSLATQALHVSGDRIQLQQVILNLVVNGIDAIGGSEYGERKIIGRTGLVDDVSAEVAIEDSGPGIPPDIAEQIFEPFFTTKSGAMGIGLSIARTIVASHRGRIWAENRRGGGATLRFSVPLATRELHGTRGGRQEEPAGREAV